MRTNWKGIQYAFSNLLNELTPPLGLMRTNWKERAAFCCTLMKPTPPLGLMRTNWKAFRPTGTFLGKTHPTAWVNAD